jgi:hypothetical protein
VQDHIAKVSDHPAISCQALLFALLLEFDTNVIQYGIREGIDHAIAGAGADDEIISKGNNFLNIDQDNIFPLFIFQGVDDFTSKFQCVQGSPHSLKFAENSFVYIEPAGDRSLLNKCTEFTLAVPILPS